MLPDRSRKRKLPFVTLTRRISGTNALSAFSGVCLASVTAGVAEDRGVECTVSPDVGGAATVLSPPGGPSDGRPSHGRDDLSAPLALILATAPSARPGLRCRRGGRPSAVPRRPGHTRDAAKRPGPPDLHRRRQPHPSARDKPLAACASRRSRREPADVPRGDSDRRCQARDGGGRPRLGLHGDRPGAGRRFVGAPSRKPSLRFGKPTISSEFSGCSSDFRSR